MLKVIVFDWDGTLADSVAKIIQCKHFLACKYHLPLPSDKLIKSVLGMKFEDALAKCFPSLSAEKLALLGQEYHELMRQDHYQAKIFPGISSLLGILKKRGIKLAIATSKDKHEMDKAIEYNNLAGMFDIICCGKEYEEKPHPAMLHYIMQEFESQPSECLMIGDTLTDIAFATNAKVKILCVTFGAHSKNILQKNNPFGFIEQWPELIKVIDGLCPTT